MDPSSPWAFAGVLFGGGAVCVALFQGAVYLASAGLDKPRRRTDS